MKKQFLFILSIFLIVYLINLSLASCVIQGNVKNLSGTYGVCMFGYDWLGRRTYAEPLGYASIQSIIQKMAATKA